MAKIRGKHTTDDTLLNKVFMQSGLHAIIDSLIFQEGYRLMDQQTAQNFIDKADSDCYNFNDTTEYAKRLVGIRLGG